MCTRTLRQGDRILADDSAGADDEYTLPCLEAAVVEQRLTRGQRDRREPRSINERHAFRRLDERIRGGNDILRCSAVGRHRQKGDDCVTHSEATDSVTQGVDRSRDVVSGDVREHHWDR